MLYGFGKHLLQRCVESESACGDQHHLRPLTDSCLAACTANFSMPEVGEVFQEVFFVEAKPPEANVIAAAQAEAVITNTHLKYSSIQCQMQSQDYIKWLACSTWQVCAVLVSVTQ